MNQTNMFPQIFSAKSILLALLFLGAPGLGLSTSAQQTESPFASKIFDLGVVVSDIEKSLKFYTEAIGFQEVEGFNVPADWAGKVGLTDKKPLDIHVLVLGEGEQATKLKLMQLPGVRSKKQDNRYIHSQRGYSYISLFVSDMNEAMDRLKKAEVKPVSPDSVPLPQGFPEDIYFTLVRDPDGNFIELIGPRK